MITQEQNSTKYSSKTVEMSVEQVGEITQGTVVVLACGSAAQQSARTRRGYCLNSVGGWFVRLQLRCL